jgi:hypothetical protein
VAGVEQRLGGPWSVKVEGYYKDYQKTVVEVPDDRIYSNEGQGLARGLELMLKHEAGGRFFGWLSYSFAESWRLDTPANGWRRFQYDQPHNLTLVGSYGLRPGWSIGARGNWHSGSLITPITGTVPDPDPNNLVGVLPVYGEPYSERLEDYVRLDLRTDYAFVFHGWKLNLYLEVINALSKSNPTGVTYSRDYSKQELVKDSANDRFALNPKSSDFCEVNPWVLRCSAYKVTEFLICSLRRAISLRWVTISLLTSFTLLALTTNN